MMISSKINALPLYSLKNKTLSFGDLDENIKMNSEYIPNNPFSLQSKETGFFYRHILHINKLCLQIQWLPHMLKSFWILLQFLKKRHDYSIYYWTAIEHTTLCCHKHLKKSTFFLPYINIYINSSRNTIKC